MQAPNDRKYIESHEWFKLDGDTVTVGITQYAADELTDITYVDLPAPGTTVSKGSAFGEVESVKATSELFSAVDGEIVEVNAELTDHPEHINDDAFGKGWMIKIKPANPDDLGALLDAEQYKQRVQAMGD